jgi:hypothetical protein
MGSTTYVVAFYEIDRKYGGPEEGGWWYDTGDLVRVFHVCKNKSEAYAKAGRANDLLRVLQWNHPSVSSVLYNGGRYEAQVFEDMAPERFPERTPYYE